jgi:2-polyprenyl-3-methyl-5-hydroxy-6-metoxy-1,4-benzoquinol methylase
MEGYILTIEQYEQIQGQEFAPYQYFNCVQDINGVWFNFVTEQQYPEIQASEYVWVLDLPQGEYVPQPPPLFPS